MKTIFVIALMILITPHASATMCEFWKPVGIPGFGDIDEWRSGGFATIGDTLYMLGGQIAEQPGVWKSTDGLLWEPVNLSYGLPFNEVYYFSSASFDGKLWYYGGGVSPGIGKDEVWNSTDGNVWYKANASATGRGRGWAGFLEFDNKLWIIGGTSLSGAWVFYNDTWWSDDGLIWHQANASAEWENRTFPGGQGPVVAGNTLWIIGGNTGVNWAENDTWYSYDGSLWYRGTRDPAYTRREADTVAYFDGKIWITGGQTNVGIPAGHSLYSSSDGINWNLVNSSTEYIGDIFPRLVSFNDKLLYYYPRGIIYECCGDGECPEAQTCTEQTTSEMATEASSSVQDIFVIGIIMAAIATVVVLVAKVMGG